MIISTRLYNTVGEAGWTLWFRESFGNSYLDNCRVIRLPVKPTKKQIRKLRRKFIKDCKSC